MKIKMKLKLKYKAFFYIHDEYLANQPVKNDASHVRAIKFFPARKASPISVIVPA
jgi:hypothetical protein